VIGSNWERRLVGTLLGRGLHLSGEQCITMDCNSSEWEKNNISQYCDRIRFKFDSV